MGSPTANLCRKADRVAMGESKRWRLSFAEKFESAGKATEVDGLLKFETKRGGGGLDFEGIDPDHSAARAERDGGYGEEFFQKSAEVRNGDAFSQRGIGDEERDAGWAVVGDLFKIAKVAKNKIG